MSQQTLFGAFLCFVTIVVLWLHLQTVVRALEVKGTRPIADAERLKFIYAVVIPGFLFAGVGISLGLVLIGDYFPETWMPVIWVTGGMIMGYQICLVFQFRES